LSNFGLHPAHGFMRFGFSHMQMVTISLSFCRFHAIDLLAGLCHFLEYITLSSKMKNSEWCATKSSCLFIQLRAPYKRGFITVLTLRSETLQLEPKLLGEICGVFRSNVRTV
jgi:hypothetical protein